MTGFLDRQFEKIGKTVVKYPKLFIVLSLVVGGGLAAGNVILEVESRPERQWVPNNAPSLDQKDYVDVMYPSSLRFSSFIATCLDTEPDCNMMEAKYIQRLADIMEDIEAVVVDGDTLRSKDSLGIDKITDDVWEVLNGQWSYAGNDTADGYGGGIVKQKCYAPGPICLGSSALGVFRNEELTIEQLTDEGALRGFQAYDSLEIFCPLSITRPDSPCFNATVFNPLAGENDCKIKGPSNDQRVACELSFRNYCAAVCDRMLSKEQCLDESCMRTQWYNDLLLDFEEADPTLDSFDPPVDQVASSGPAGPKRDAMGRLESAKALVTSLFLGTTPIVFEGAESDPIAEEWENAVLCRLGYQADRKDEVFKDCEQDDLMKIVPFFARSISDEFGAEISSDIPFVSAPYLLVPVYLIIMMSRRDHVHSMVTMGLVSGVIVAISYFGCTGAGGLVGVFSSQLTGTLPLLLLGLGVDDAFVIVGEYERYFLAHPKSTPEERVVAAAKNGGVSILITSVTDALAFLIGSSTVLPALSWFCVMAGFGVVICFVLQLTMFIPALLLNARRSDANRWDCCCCCGPKDNIHEFHKPQGCCKCCNCAPDMLEGVCAKVGKATSTGWTRIATLAVFAGLFGMGVAGMASIVTNFEFEWFLPEDAYSREFFALNTDYFGGGVNFDVFTRDMDYFVRQAEMGKIGAFLSTTEVIDQDVDIGDWHQQFLDDAAENTPEHLGSDGLFMDRETYYKSLLEFFQGANGWGTGANLRGNVKWNDPLCDEIEAADSTVYLPPLTVGACPDLVAGEEECFTGAEASFGADAIMSNITTTGAGAPRGCSVTRTAANANTYDVTYNGDATASTTCGAANPDQVQGLYKNNFLRMDVHVDQAADLVTITMRGLASGWFGAGFGTKDMIGAYTIIVEADGAVHERVLGDHVEGDLISDSITKVSEAVMGPWRTVVLTRPLVGATERHLTFSTGDTAMPVIAAVGSTPVLRQHLARDNGVLLMTRTDTTPTCMCQLPADLVCDHMAGIKGSRISATLTMAATTGGVTRYNTLVTLREGLGAFSADLGDEAPFPYTSTFSNWEEVGVIGDELTQNLLITGGVVTVIIGLMIPHPRIAVFVVLAIVLSIIDLVGFMHWWGLTINGVSTIYILLSCGLAVDYSAHIAHMFVVSTGTSQERVEAAMVRIGPSVFNGVASTFVAVISLSLTKTYVFQVFAKALALIVVFGGAHGLLLLPALLSIFGGSKAHEAGAGKASPPAATTSVKVQPVPEAAAAAPAATPPKEDSPPASQPGDETN